MREYNPRALNEYDKLAPPARLGAETGANTQLSDFLTPLPLYISSY